MSDGQTARLQPVAGWFLIIQMKVIRICLFKKVHVLEGIQIGTAGVDRSR